jgi:hypothetical protein
MQNTCMKHGMKYIYIEKSYFHRLSIEPSNMAEESEDQQQVPYAWNCTQCTFLNPLSSHRCEMCNHTQMHIRNPDPIPTTTRRQQFGQRQLNNDPDGNSTLTAVVGGTALGCIAGGLSSYIRGTSISDGVFQGGINGAIIGAIDSLFRQGHSSTRTSTLTQNLPSSIITTREINETPRQLPLNHDLLLRSFQNMLNSVNSTRPEVTDSSYESHNLIPEQHQVSPSNDILFLQLFEDLLNSRDLHFQPDNLSLEDIDFEHLLSIFGDGTENMGASQAEIDSLPTHTIKNLEKDLPSIDLQQCVICLEDFKSGDERKILPCFHGYHKECIDHALRNRATCPLCNSSLN